MQQWVIAQPSSYCKLDPVVRLAAHYAVFSQHSFSNRNAVQRLDVGGQGGEKETIISSLSLTILSVSLSLLLRYSLAHWETFGAQGSSKYSNENFED